MKRFLVLSLILLALAGCGRLQRIKETPYYKSGYTFEWPASVSKDPSAFQTVEVDGRMITSVPDADTTPTLTVSP